MRVAWRHLPDADAHPRTVELVLAAEAADPAARAVRNGERFRGRLDFATVWAELQAGTEPPHATGAVRGYRAFEDWLSIVPVVLS